MVYGYVSSDDEDDDDYDFGYSEPLVRKTKPVALPPIQTKKLRDELHAALEESKKIELFLRAIDEDDIKVLNDLLSLGVSVDSSNPTEWTPLLKACSLGKVEVVRFLLEHGSNPNLSKGKFYLNAITGERNLRLRGTVDTSELFTPLMACCTYSLTPEDLKLSCLRLLIQYGSDVNCKDKYRTTALMHAAGSGYLEIVKELLLVDGIDVNVQDKDGWTALFYAVNNNNLEMAKKFIAAGSYINLKDRYERTVINLAVEKEMKEMAEILGYKEESQPVEPEVDLFYNSVSHVLKELPDSNGLGGFPSEVEAILSFYKHNNLKDIGFLEFLNATDEDLKKIGIKFEFDRKQILAKVIHRYHLRPWRKSSMPEINIDNSLSMEDVITITGNLVRHLTIANATLMYLQTRISSRTVLDSEELFVEREMIEVFVNTFQVVERMKFTLQRILKLVEQIKPLQLADYICEYKNMKEREKSKRLLRNVWYVVGAATIGFLIYRFKI